MAISVNTMRAIDHWVGVPLCALISPVVALMDSIKNIFTSAPHTPKKLLFIELSEMGSAILVDPAMRNAQARGAELYFLIDRKFVKERRDHQYLNQQILI